MSVLTNQPDAFVESPNHTPEPPGSDPFGGLTPRSFTNLLTSNGNDLSFSMFDTWNNPFSASLTHSGIEAAIDPSNYVLPASALTLGNFGLSPSPWNANNPQSVVQSFMPMGFEGGFPTSGFNFNPLVSFGNTDPRTQNQFNLNDMGTTVGYPASQPTNDNHAPFPSTTQWIPSPFPPPGPLFDITASVQPLAPPALPPTQPGVVNPPQDQFSADADGDDAATSSLGRSKRKPAPSQRAQRDNMIGKENRVPAPASVATENTKNRGKKRVSNPHLDGRKPSKRRKALVN